MYEWISGEISAGMDHICCRKLGCAPRSETCAVVREPARLAMREMDTSNMSPVSCPEVKDRAVEEAW